MARRARILPFPVPYPEPEDDRLLLWASLAVALLLHLGLLFLPIPWDDADAAPEAPPRLIHRLVNLRPPEREPPPAPEPLGTGLPADL